jgi:hypothetical protein
MENRYERELKLNSVPPVASDPKNVSHDFTTKFDTPLILGIDNGWEVALNKVTMTYSWYNVRDTYNNNLLAYSPDGGTTWKQIMLINGIYSYTDIDSYIHSVMVLNGDYISSPDGPDYYQFNINFHFDDVNYRTQFTLSNNYQVDLTLSDFNNLIGFNKEVVTATKQSESLPNITNNIDSVHIHCSLVSESVLDSTTNTDVIFSFSTATLQKSYPFQVQDFRAYFYPCTKNTVIDSIRMYITDPTGMLIDLNGIPVEYSIILRPVKK